ncbi:MAG: pyridoxamine 5'-phosphate oxidase family protein [Coriobacteriales bacterium]|nr:pyridoxamine 5'-phosphate oxidase family protein [Coriobacteriales bacterium]
MHLVDRQITNHAELEAIIGAGRFATLAMARNEEPYAVTLSYGYDRENRRLYFHSAHEGLKLEFIAKNPRVCATIVIDRGYLDGQCAHAYSSVVMHGDLVLVDDPDEMRHGMRTMCRQLESNPYEVYARHRLDDDETYKRMAVLRLQIHEMTAKQGS